MDGSRSAAAALDLNVPARNAHVDVPAGDPIVLTFRVMRAWRCTSSFAILGVGVGLLVSHAVQHALSVAVLVLGGFAVGHWLVDVVWNKVGSNGVAGTNEQFVSGFRDTAAVYISTPGIVLGLLAVFGQDLGREPIHVASIALAVTLLTGIVVQGLLAGGVPSDEPRLAFLGYFLNVLLWALGLGTLCVALAIVYS
jgi:hypothetical protein